MNLKKFRQANTKPTSAPKTNDRKSEMIGMLAGTLEDMGNYLLELSEAHKGLAELFSEDGREANALTCIDAATQMDETATRLMQIVQAARQVAREP
jgi:hypothetical protein